MGKNVLVLSNKNQETVASAETSLASSVAAGSSVIDISTASSASTRPRLWEKFELSFQSMKRFRTERSKAMFRDRQIGIGVIFWKMPSLHLRLQVQQNQLRSQPGPTHTWKLWNLYMGKNFLVLSDKNQEAVASAETSLASSVAAGSSVIDISTLQCQPHGSRNHILINLAKLASSGASATLTERSSFAAVFARMTQR